MLLEHIIAALVQRRFYANRDHQLGARATDTAVALRAIVADMAAAQTDVCASLPGASRGRDGADNSSRLD
jgi:selenocysteine lyase/cysteine desulfurase